MKLSVIVHGVPGPQGSKRHVGNGRMIESSAKVKPWRDAVVAAVGREMTRTGWVQVTGPVSLGITFFLARPKGHYGTGRNAGTLRKSAPAYPAVKPDADKLIRSTQDALTTVGAWRDDAQAVDLFVCKRYAAPNVDIGATFPGCLISLQEIGGQS